jgi:protease-4
MDSQRNDAASTRARWVLVVAAAVLVSAVAAPVVWEETQGQQQAVAVVHLDGYVSSSMVDTVSEDLREARQNDTVKAVVLQVDSPGGSAAASEQLYTAVQRTAQEMPVVSTVGATGASGAYYAMLPSEAIYVTPASMVGSVGVRGGKPIPPTGQEIRTGPDKASGTLEQRRAQIESLRRAFVGTVMKHREDDLSISREQVSHAKIYAGAQATQNGIADEIGTKQDAIRRAADEAGLDRYTVVEKEPERQSGIFLLSSGNGTAVVVEQSPVGYDGVRSPTFLMVYGDVRYQDEVIGNVSA